MLLCRPLSLTLCLRHPEAASWYHLNVRAISKTSPAPGVDVVEVSEPAVRPGHVKIRVRSGSVCGTDLHIYRWDAFAANRIHPPRIIGHEFCGDIIEVGEGVSPDRVGQFVSSESHVVCGHCLQCRTGNAHVCANTVLLGIDVDGGFARYAVIPESNAHLTPSSVPHEVASMLDALGNAVHTVMDGATNRSLEGQTVLITGLGPIGLFSVAIAKTLGAKKVIATEIKTLRKNLGAELGADHILDPTQEDVAAKLHHIAPEGVDFTLEMSGHPSALPIALEHTRPGGHVSLLGLFHDQVQPVEMNKLVMKGLKIHGIIGRRLPDTWDQMIWLLDERKLNVLPVVTDQMDFSEVHQAMEKLEAGQAGKVVLDFTNA